MGNEHSTDRIVYHTQSEIHIDQKSLTFVRTKTDPRFGEIDEFQHNESKEKIFRKNVIIDDPNLRTDSHLLGLKNRVNQRHTNLLQTYGFIIETEELDSNEITKISVYFEHFATDASVEFRARKKSQNAFQEDELLGSLLYSLHVLHFLQGKEINHGNMVPGSILMGADGEIKLADHSLLNTDHSLYRQISKGLQTPYVAPELLPLIKNKEEPSSSKFNPYKADAFSLGMTFLYAALLNEPLECYDWDTLNFNGAHLFDLYEKVRERYSGPFANILQSLIKIDPKDRPDFLDLVQNIEYHKNNDFYARDPRYAHAAPKIVVSGADFVSKHLKSPRSQPRSLTPHEKGADYYTPIKRDLSPQTSFLYNSREQIEQSKIDSKAWSHPMLKNLNITTQNTLTYNFVDPKVQAIIRESREKTAVKSQLSSPNAAGHLVHAFPAEYATTIKPSYQAQPTSVDARYTPSTYNATANASVTVNSSVPLRSNTYQNILGYSGIQSSSSAHTQEFQSFDHFNPRFNNPFIEGSAVKEYNAFKSYETPGVQQQHHSQQHQHQQHHQQHQQHQQNQQHQQHQQNHHQHQQHQHQEIDKYAIAARELIKKEVPYYEDHSKQYSYGFSGAKSAEVDVPKRSDFLSDEQFYQKYGISAHKPTTTATLTENITVKPPADDKLSFNSSKVNELIAQIRAQNYSPGSVSATIEQINPITVTSYEKNSVIPAPKNYSPVSVTSVEHTNPISVISYEKSQFATGAKIHSPYQSGIHSVTSESKDIATQNLLAELKKKYLEEEKTLHVQQEVKSEDRLAELKKKYLQEEKNLQVHQETREQKPESEFKRVSEIKTGVDAAKVEGILSSTQGHTKTVVTTVGTEEKAKKQEKPVTPKNDSGTDDIVKELRQRYGKASKSSGGN